MPSSIYIAMRIQTDEETISDEIGFINRMTKAVAGIEIGELVNSLDNPRKILLLEESLAKTPFAPLIQIKINDTIFHIEVDTISTTIDLTENLAENSKMIAQIQKTLLSIYSRIKEHLDEVLLRYVFFIGMLKTKRVDFDSTLKNFSTEITYNVSSDLGNEEELYLVPERFSYHVFSHGYRGLVSLNAEIDPSTSSGKENSLLHLNMHHFMTYADSKEINIAEEYNKLQPVIDLVLERLV